MYMPTVYITGMGGSGTTFTFHLFYNAGWQTETDTSPLGRSFGGPSGQYGTHRGMEWIPFRLIAQCIGEEMGRPQGKAYWTEYELEKVPLLRGKYSSLVQSLDYPEVIKCPDFGQHILFDYFKPKHTIVMVRPVDDRAERAKGLYGQGLEDDIAFGTAAGTGLIIHALEDAQLSYTVVQFPKVVEDIGYAFFKLRDLVGKNFMKSYRDTVGVRLSQRRED